MTTAFQSGAFQQDAFQIDAAGTSYSLIGDPGSYSLAGGTASLSVGRKITANAGSYSLSGGSATLKAGRALTANAGTYSITGGSATLTKTGGGTSYTLTALAGEYKFTGFDYVNGDYVVDDYVTGSAVMELTRRLRGGGGAKKQPQKPQYIDDAEVMEIIMMFMALEEA